MRYIQLTCDFELMCDFVKERTLLGADKDVTPGSISSSIFITNHDSRACPQAPVNWQSPLAIATDHSSWAVSMKSV